MMYGWVSVFFEVYVIFGFFRCEDSGVPASCVPHLLPHLESFSVSFIVHSCVSSSIWDSLIECVHYWAFIIYIIIDRSLWIVLLLLKRAPCLFKFRLR